MITDLEAPKIALEQLQYTKFVNEDMDQKEAKSPKAAKKGPSNEDIEAQGQKSTKKANICLALGAIFWVFLAIATIFGIAYCSYYHGTQIGIEAATKVAEEYFDKNVIVRAKIDLFGDGKGLDSDNFRIAPSENSQIKKLRDIMNLVWDYEEECKSPKLSDWMGGFYVTKSCLKKLREKNHIVSATSNTDSASALYFRL